MRNIQVLLERLPVASLIRFNVFSPTVHNYLINLPDIVYAKAKDIYFTVIPDQFKYFDCDEVIKLTAVDKKHFEGCEHVPNWEYVDEETGVYVILKDGKVASSVCVTPMTPEGSVNKQVVSVGALYTETRYRKMGLARKLVSYATKLIITDNKTPIYWTSEDNIAS